MFPNVFGDQALPLEPASQETFPEEFKLVERHVADRLEDLIGGAITDFGRDRAMETVQSALAAKMHCASCRQCLRRVPL